MEPGPVSRSCRHVTLIPSFMWLLFKPKGEDDFLPHAARGAWPIRLTEPATAWGPSAPTRLPLGVAAGDEDRLTGDPTAAGVHAETLTDGREGDPDEDAPRPSL